jgi:nitric oxide dioxygenase
MLLHADDSPESFPLRQQVEDQGLSGSTFQGFMDVNAVELPLDAAHYLCGPLPFLQAVRSALITNGVPAKDIQYEVFGPDLWLADFQ